MTTILQLLYNTKHGDNIMTNMIKMFHLTCPGLYWWACFYQILGHPSDRSMECKTDWQQ